MIVLTPVIMLPLLFSYTLPWVYLGPLYHLYMGFPGGSDGKASALNVGDPGSIPWSGRSPEEENGNPLQYSCLENSMDGGAWWATKPTHGWRNLVGCKELDMTQQHGTYHLWYFSGFSRETVPIGYINP